MKQPWNKLKMKKSDTAFSLYQECKKLFPVWCWNEKSLKSVVNDRDGDYEIEFAPNIEADENFKNLSANDLKDKGIVGITLPERLKLEIQYFKATGKHLDIENITLCSGSRYSDGYVPHVHWYDVEVFVYWYYPVRANDSLRSRQAVSKTSDLNLETLPDELEINGVKYIKKQKVAKNN